MSRIRTVKPDLFRHDELFDAEIESGLPLRLSFIGLFTVADCEGRFIWKPRTLKLDVLPYDAVDFAAVLNALEQGGFIQRYEVNGKIYGLIPTFTKHQSFPTREIERGSALPPPPEPPARTEHEPVPARARTEHEPVPAQARTEHEPVPAQARTEHEPKLQEGEGNRKGNKEGEEEGRVPPRPPSPKTPCPADLAVTPELQAWATAHGYHENLGRHLDHFRDKAIAKGYQYADWTAALRNAIRDDWAGLRQPPPQQRAAPGGGRAPHRKAEPATPEGARFAAILENLNRPLIDGELADAIH